MAMLKDRGGNFGMMAALAMPLILAAGGVAIDMAKMVTTKNQMQDAADAAALAAASALVSKEKPDIAKAKEIATNFLKAQTTGTVIDTPGSGSGTPVTGSLASAKSAPAEELEVNASTVDISRPPTARPARPSR